MLPCYEGSVRLILDIPCLLGTVAGHKVGRFWPEPIAKTKPRFFAPSTPRKPLLDHFISSIWLQWVVFLPCYVGSVRLILDMPCPLGNVAGQKFGRFWPEPIAKTKPRFFAPSIQKTTAGPFHILHMTPMGGILAML
jgi:hypothetical protein